MKKLDIAKSVIKDNGGIAKTAQLNEVGIRNSEIVKMCESGELERIKHGYYQIADRMEISEEKMIATFFKEGIVCMESALFYYGYNDFSPREWSIAVPRTATRAVKNIVEFPMKAYYIQKYFLDIGKSTSNFNGVILPAYDRERTICDCFKYRTKLDNEIFNKAVNAYAVDEKKNLANLSKYAKEMKLYTKVMNVMEVLLNG